jgi:hypothetical protein
MVVPANKFYQLESSIVPQLFVVRDGEILYFDKINQHEGRFCKKDNRGSNIILEVGEGQGTFNENGDLYVIQSGEKTIINRYSLSGDVTQVIEIEGCFFDFKINESGHYICLGYENNTSAIKLINNKGQELVNIKPNNILFASCIYLENDCIYLGAFDNNNVFKIIKMNYIGNMENEWTIGVDSNERIISKVIKYNKLIFAVASGKDDSLVILNTENGIYKEIFPKDIGLRDFIDINVYEDKVLLLDEKCVYEYTIESLTGNVISKRRRKVRNDMSLLPYQFLMYTRGAQKQFIFSLNISAIITLLLFFYFCYKGSAYETGIYDLLIAMFDSLWILGVLIALTISTISFINKSVRIEYLLYIYQNNISTSLMIPFISGVTSFCVISLIFLPNFNIIKGIPIAAIFFLITYIVDSISIKRVRNQNKDIVIELLSEEGQFKDYLKTVLENVNRKNNEKLYIDIVVEGTLKKNAFTRWVKSRKNIIRHEVEVNIQDNKIRTVLDLSKRDVKYSRISILMDYICFVKEFANIKEIEIGCIEDKGC